MEKFNATLFYQKHIQTYGKYAIISIMKKQIKDTR